MLCSERLRHMLSTRTFRTNQMYQTKPKILVKWLLRPAQMLLCDIPAKRLLFASSSWWSKGSLSQCLQATTHQSVRHQTGQTSRHGSASRHLHAPVSLHPQRVADNAMLVGA